LRIRERGSALLHHPLHNKGTAFSREERSAFGLEGLLPNAVSDLEIQMTRNYESIRRKEDPLEQYIGLVALQDRNETLFYRLLLEHTEEFLPIVYTPTVGLATQRYSHIFRRARGIWITPGHRGQIKAVLENAPCRDVRLIVVTDGERILGLGDQGAGGMGIPIGKLSLYTVGAGIHPAETLPICLDVGTDNQGLLDDPLYIGWRKKRLRGPLYDDLVEEFVEAVELLFPQALLQWEDFKKVNAMRLLERYRHRLLSFNDDIQGTAAIGLAGVLAGVRATSIPLSEHRVVILGAGAAGVGIADQIAGAMKRTGLAAHEVSGRIAMLDSRGLLVEGRTYREGEDYKQRYSVPSSVATAQGLARDEGITLEQVVRAFKPSVLIGTSGQPGAFTESVIREMAGSVDRPLVFPLSNPTAKAEAKPADVIAWSEGRGIVATGSPFPPVEYEGKVHRIGQGNNVFIFPGVGLGALVVEAREVTDSMFTVAAETLAKQVSTEELAVGQIYPDLGRLREVSKVIAEAVAVEAMASGVSPRIEEEELERRLSDSMWVPVYHDLKPA
jgi:malic enzyme